MAVKELKRNKDDTRMKVAKGAMTEGEMRIYHLQDSGLHCQESKKYVKAFIFTSLCIQDFGYDELPSADKIGSV